MVFMQVVRVERRARLLFNPLVHTSISGPGSLRTSRDDGSSVARLDCLDVSLNGPQPGLSQ